MKNDGLLAARVAELLKFGNNEMLLIIVTAVVGMAALSANILRSPRRILPHHY